MKRNNKMFLKIEIKRIKLIKSYRELIFEKPKNHLKIVEEREKLAMEIFFRPETF